MSREVIMGLWRAHGLMMDNPEAQDEILEAIAALSATPQAAQVPDDKWRAFVDEFVGEAALRELRRRFDAQAQGDNT